MLPSCKCSDSLYSQVFLDQGGLHQPVQGVPGAGCHLKTLVLLCPGESAAAACLPSILTWNLESGLSLQEMSRAAACSCKSPTFTRLCMWPHPCELHPKPSCLRDGEKSNLVIYFWFYVPTYVCLPRRAWRVCVCVLYQVHVAIKPWACIATGAGTTPSTLVQLALAAVALQDCSLSLA